MAERVVVLDTHPFVWWSGEERLLSRRAASALQRADRIVVPGIVCYEMALLVERGRLRLKQPLNEWLVDACSADRVELAGITADIAIAAMGIRRALDGGDPADHIIAATALRLNAPLVTRDASLSQLKVIETIW